MAQQNPKVANYQILDVDVFKSISSWHHYAILALAQAPSNKYDDKWIAKILNISTLDAKAALDRLLRLSLIEKSGRGFRQCTKALETPPDVSSSAIRAYHRQNLELAETTLDGEDITKRSFSSLTIACDEEGFAYAKTKMNEFLKKLNAELETEKPTRVYTIALQVFPVSREF